MLLKEAVHVSWNFLKIQIGGTANKLDETIN